MNLSSNDSSDEVLMAILNAIFDVISSLQAMIDNDFSLMMSNLNEVESVSNPSSSGFIVMLKNLITSNEGVAVQTLDLLSLTIQSKLE